MVWKTWPIGFSLHLLPLERTFLSVQFLHSSLSILHQIGAQILFHASLVLHFWSPPCHVKLGLNKYYVSLINLGFVIGVSIVTLMTRSSVLPTCSCYNGLLTTVTLPVGNTIIKGSITHSQQWSKNTRWKNSRNRKSVSFTSHTRLSNVIESCAVPICPSEDRDYLSNQCICAACFTSLLAAP